MTNHPMLAAVVLCWLIGAVVGWVAGWVARGEQNRTWHRDTARQLAETRAHLAEALDQLDAAHTWGQVERLAPPAAPAVVHVHVAASLPWAAPEPMPGDMTHRVVGALPVLAAAEEVSS
ncbi:MAG: hypothetical protein ACREX8_03930 [Gammaproteobacteria bacterium]